MLFELLMDLLVLSLLMFIMAWLLVIALQFAMLQLLAVLMPAQINGARTITSVIDENRYKVTAGAAANTSEDGGGIPQIVTHAPTEQWFEQSYSAPCEVIQLP
jgi:hypothetical protein